jgi:ABC-2 type transport system permease protein
VAAALDHLALLTRYFGISIRGQLQYRASFLMGFLANAVVTVVEFLGLWALFDRFGPLPGWSLAEAALLYGTVNASFALADVFAGGLERFGSLFVRTGDFDRLLVRPRPTLLQLAGYEFALRRFGRFAQALVILIWALVTLDPAWGIAEAVVLAGAVIGGVALFTGLLVLHAALGFWTVETLEIGNTLTYGGVQTTQYPITVYQRWLRRAFTWIVPLACVSYFPVVFVLGIDDPLGSSRVFQALAPLTGPAFLLLAIGVWRLGERRYCSTGS